MASQSVLLAGTKEKSLGKYFARRFQKIGWETWLYGRSAVNYDNVKQHVRKCDITLESDADNLLLGIPSLDVVIHSADSGSHGLIENLAVSQIREGIMSKIFGSVLLTKKILQRWPDRKFKMIWLAGSPAKKPKDLLLYGPINSAILELVNELNLHYGNRIESYYLETPLVSPSSLGDEYIASRNDGHALVSEKPESVFSNITFIIQGKYPAGPVRCRKGLI